MGLLDFFKKKPSDDDAVPPSEGAEPNEPADGDTARSEKQAGTPVTWKQRFADWDDKENEDQAALLEEFLGQVAQEFDNGKVKPLLDERKIDLRARVGGRPYRARVDAENSQVHMELKIANRAGEIDIERDHDKIPKEKDEDEDWADEDELRVFVAKGIFTEGEEDEVNETLATLRSLDESVTAKLYAEMERLPVDSLLAMADQLVVHIDPALHEAEQPDQIIRDAARLMDEFAQSLEGGGRDLSEQSGGAGLTAAKRVTCSYCRSLFMLGTRPECPNCGAPYKSG